jgi:hypothetical protein
MTSCSIVFVNSGFRSGFVVNRSCKVSAKEFTFSCCVIADLLFSFKGRMLLWSLVKCFVILDVSSILFVSKLWSVSCQLPQS